MSLHHKTTKSLGVLAVLLVGLLVSCTIGVKDSQGVTSTEPTPVSDQPSEETSAPLDGETTPNSQSTSTSIPVSLGAGNPEEALATYGFFKKYTMTSQVSKSSCGVFAVGIDSIQPHFLEYISGEWVDHSELMFVNTDFPPYRVKSLDLNADSILEFAIFYNEEKLEDTNSFGMIFFQNGCSWQWATIDYELGGNPNQAINLDYDETKNQLYGYNVPDLAGYLVKHTIRYLPQSKSFIYEPIAYEPPPIECLNAFYDLERSDDPNTIVSFGNSSVLRTLQSCQYGDWILEAKRHFSTYDNISDAYYNDYSFVLLKNESASQILNSLCDYVDGRGNYPFRTTNPVAIACIR